MILILILSLFELGEKKLESNANVLTESRQNQISSGSEDYLIDKNTETLEALTPQLNILDRDQ